MLGTRVAETILASARVRAPQKAGHMSASDPIKIYRNSLREGGRPHMAPRRDGGPGLPANGCTCGAPSITRASFSTCWSSAGATSGRHSDLGGELLDDHVVQVNPSHSEVWGHNPF